MELPSDNEMSDEETTPQLLVEATASRGIADRSDQGQEEVTNGNLRMRKRKSSKALESSGRATRLSFRTTTTSARRATNRADSGNITEYLLLQFRHSVVCKRWQGRDVLDD